MTSPATPARDAQLALAETVSDPSPGRMLQLLIEKGNPEANIGVLERLIALKERADAREAEREFNRAFAELQKELVGFQATAAVPNSDGTTRYFFLPYEALMEKLNPMLARHGFALSFDTENDGDKVTQKCTVIHASGHSRTNRFSARISPPPKSSNAQADGATSTFAKRYAVCNMFNIVAEQPDMDARVVGEPISADKVQYLEEQLTETRSNRTAFLKFAGVEKLEDIGEAQYPVLVRALEAKKRPV